MVAAITNHFVDDLALIKMGAGHLDTAWYSRGHGRGAEPSLSINRYGR